MRRHIKYVVGFDTDNYAIYGLDCDCCDWVNPMSKTEAKKKEVELLSERTNNRKNNPKVVIYELVPVKV